MAVKHTFTAPAVDSGNPNEVGSGEWNADHTITELDLTAISSRTTTGSTDGATWTFAAFAEIRWSGASALSVHGIGGGVAGRTGKIVNATTAQVLTLKHQSATDATATRRLILPGSQDYLIPPGEGVIVSYDATTTRWRIVGAVASDGTIVLTDVTTGNVSTTRHGFVPKAPNVASQFLDGTGAWDTVKDTDFTMFFEAVFSKAGVLTTGTGAHRWYNRTGRTLTFDSVTASVGTAPTGAAVIVDVNKGGTTIYSTQGNRPTIAISTNVHDNTTAPNTTTIADNEYLTIDIDQIGSTVAGADLTVQVWMRG